MSELHAPAAQCGNPAGDSSRRQGGGQTGWVVVPTGALMTWTHLGRLLHGHSRSSVAVYLLFPVARPDFLRRTRRLLAVSALLWDFMPHLQTHESRYDKHGPLRAPWPRRLLRLPWHQPHTEQSPTVIYIVTASIKLSVTTYALVLFTLRAT